MPARVEVGLSLGSNLGDKAGHIRRALAALVGEGLLSDVTVSRLYRTAPWGHVVEQDWFVNACAFGFTERAPVELLAGVKAIEERLGRRETVRWGPRVIDIDLLYVGEVELDTPDLTLPHKEILRRSFVLVPLAEIRPDRLINGVTVRDAAQTIGFDGIEPIPDDATSSLPASLAPTIRVIRAGSFRPVPWKNGGGSTVELAVYPENAGFDAFLWRLSMADVASDGPFSTFPEVDRTLVLLEGRGAVLDIDGRSHRLDKAPQSVAFPGDVRTSAALIDGPIRDFNVMTRRGRFDHAVDVVGAGPLDVDGLTLLLALEPCTIEAQTDSWHLAAQDSLLVTGPGRLVSSGKLLCTRIRPSALAQ